MWLCCRYELLALAVVTFCIATIVGCRVAVFDEWYMATHHADDLHVSQQIKRISVPIALGDVYEFKSA